MADDQVQNQDIQKVDQTKQGCGCGGNTQRNVPAALAERIKKRQDKIYKTKSKVF